MKENKGKCCEVCFRGTDIMYGALCNNPQCSCHTPQATSTEESASQSASPESWKHELWVKINEFHLATLITDDTSLGSHKHEENKIVVLHQIIQTIEQEKQRSVEEYKERLAAKALTLIINDEEHFGLDSSIMKIYKLIREEK